MLAIGYGSLYPFSYRSEIAVAAPWLALLQEPISWTNFPDVVGNVILFVPLGLCVRLLNVRMRPWVLASWFVLFVVYAYVIQVEQYHFSGRDPSLADVLWNALGCAIGIFAAIFYRHIDAKRLSASATDRSVLPFLLIALWLGSELAPFVPSLDVQHLKDALKPLREWDIQPVRIFALSCGIAVCAEALRLAFGVHGLWRRLIALVVLMLLGKLLVATHAWHWSTFFAVPIGFLLAQCVLRMEADTRRLVLAALLLTGYTLSAIVPFALRSDPVDMEWIPFAARLRGNMLANLDSLFLSVFYYTAMLWLLASQGAKLRGLCVFLALWALAIEWAQTWIAGRSPDATEALLVIGGALLVAQARPQAKLRVRGTA